MTNKVLSNQRPKWFYTNSNSGWTSNYIALAWLKEVFIPQTQPDNPDEIRLLICDGNSSHADDLFMKTCIENKINALYLLILILQFFFPLSSYLFFISYKTDGSHMF